MDCKARDEFKPQQPEGCEDFNEEHNAASRFFAPPVYILGGGPPGPPRLLLTFELSKFPNL